MHIKNEKLNSAKKSGYRVYYQKITINYKTGKGILLFLYSRKGEFSNFSGSPHKNYEPDHHIQPINPSQRKAVKEDQYDPKKNFGINPLAEQAPIPGPEEIFRLKVYTTTFFFKARNIGYFFTFDSKLQTITSNI